MAKQVRATEVRVGDRLPTKSHGTFTVVEVRKEGRFVVTVLDREGPEGPSIKWAKGELVPVERASTLLLSRSNRLGKDRR